MTSAGPAVGIGLSNPLLNRALGSANAELEQFATNTLSSPQPIVASHALDEIDRLGRHLRPTERFLRAAPPEQPKTLAVPAQDGRRLDQKRSATRCWCESGEKHQNGPIHRPETWSGDAPTGNLKLFAQHSVLADQLATGSEAVQCLADHEA